MRDRPSRELVDALRRAVDQVERNTDLAPDDPALVHLKKILVLRIAALKGADTAPDSIKSCTPLATAAIQDDEPLCATRKRLGLSSEAHSKLVSEAFPMLTSGISSDKELRLTWLFRTALY